MSELYDLGSGYWPDELDKDGNLLNEDLDENQPWENWRLHLFGGEAGEILEEKTEVDKVLKNLGYKIVKDNEWISIDDRLPDKCDHNYFSRCVLTYVKENLCSYTAYYDHQNELWKCFNSDKKIYSGTVTHWKPLPEPPK